MASNKISFEIDATLKGFREAWHEVHAEYAVRDMRIAELEKRIKHYETEIRGLPPLHSAKDFIIDVVNALQLIDAMQTPYPVSVWPMTNEQYAEAIPDPHLRTAISGYLARFGWEIAINQVRDILHDALGEIRDAK